MKSIYRPVPITENIYWVGAIDWNIRDFHGYTTSRGTTYNAYLILGEKNILVDTVKGPFKNEMMSRISWLIPPADIDYIITNHAEIDHSGCLAETIAATKPSQVFTSVMGVKALQDLFGLGEKLTPVKDGQTVTLGKEKIIFLETRMLHWPDSMFAYLPDRGLLFSQDAFGMHLAASKRFHDEIDPAIIYEEGQRYYANIILPYSPLVLKLIERVVQAGLALNIIAPDHGPVWRRETGKIVDYYARWATQNPEARGVVLFDSMWGATESMARALGEGLADGGLEARIISVRGAHRSDIISAVHQAGVLAIGSSTLNGRILPGLADTLNYISGLKPRLPLGAAFGAYGWSGEAPEQIETALKELKVELPGPAIRARQRPQEADLTACYERGLLLAEKYRQNR